MKNLLALGTAAAIVLAAVGCQPQKPASQKSALDVSPTASTSVTAMPTYSNTNTLGESSGTQTPANSAAGSGAVASAGNSYTVKKGDTLYRIAKEHYGDGKQWQRIASANPGVSPASLKVGQLLTLP